MKQNRGFRRVLSLILAAAMLAGFWLPVGAVEADSDLYYEIEQIENSAVTAALPMEQMGSVGNGSSNSGLNPNEMVRVSIQLEKAPTIDAGFETRNIALNASAMSYRDSRQTE